MKYLRAVLLASGLFCMLGAPMLAHAAPERPTIVSLRLDGVVDPFEADYISSGISAAENESASAVLLSIDTPGGLDSSMRKIVQSILNARVPVICYVSPEGARAASAGTFIMEACPVAAMAPNTNIGAAHPVGVNGVIEQEKVTNDAVALIRDLASRHDRNADWAERAVRDSISASSADALRLHVVDLIEPGTTSLLRDVDGTLVTLAGNRAVALDTDGAVLAPRGLGIGSSILHGLLSPDFAFIFFYLGLGLLVAGLLHHPVALIGGVLCLAAAFVAFGVLPVSLIGILLLLASAAFFLLELKHPGIGLPAVGGVICLILGGLFLFNPHVPNARVSPFVIGPVAVFTALFFGFAVSAAVRARRLPKHTGRDLLVGAEGIVTSVLEPIGVVQVLGERWSAESDGETIPEGTTVVVTGMDGLTLRVKPVTERVEGSLK